MVSLPNWRQVLRVMTFLLLLAIVIPFVVYAVPATVGADGSYVVLSGSMEPAIETGDVVLVKDVDTDTIGEGDVITYVRSGEETPTTHRVISVEESDGERSFRTQGDANEDPDASPVPAEQVNGVIIFTIPYIGHVVEFANTPYGFAALVGVPFGLLFVSEAISFFRGSRGTKAASDSGDEEPSGTESEDAEGDEQPAPAATGAAGTAQTEAADDAGDDTIAITRKDLRLSLVLLVGIAIYSGWIVTLIQEPWSFAVAFASGIGVLLAGGMYYFAGPQGGAGVEDGSAGEGDAPASPSDGSAARPVANQGAVDSGDRTGDTHESIVSGTLLAANGTTVEVEVDGLQELVELAAETDEWIIDDKDSPRYYLPGIEVTYSWYPDPEAEEVEPRVEDDEAGGDIETDSDSPPVPLDGSEAFDDAFEFPTPATEGEVDSETRGKSNAESAPEAEWKPDAEPNRPDAVSAGGTNQSGETGERLENNDS